MSSASFAPVGNPGSRFGPQYGRRYVRARDNDGGASEIEKVGALLPARRGKFTGKISGKLQAGRREQPTRARPRPTRASSFPSTIKHHQHRLVRGFCAVATECRLHVSTVLEVTLVLLVVKCRDMEEGDGDGGGSER